MLVKELLPKLKLGSSVAEHDAALERYFIETETFRSLIQGDCDIIAGDKGTGKTALYRILEQRFGSLEEMHDIEVIPAFNPVGNPVFQRLTEDDPPLEEGQYVGLWKAYFLALAGNWVLEIYEGSFTEKMDELHSLLTETGLRSADSGANTVFSQVVNLFRRFTRLDATEVTIAMTPQGLPVITPRVEFAAEDQEKPAMVEHDRALTLLDEVLSETGYAVWLVLDRLDEAFQGFPEAEIPALRALFRTYLDLQAFE